MWRVLVFWFALTGTAWASETQQAEQVKAAFDDWRMKHGVTAALAIVHESRVVMQAGEGVGIPKELASLAKAVTAVCLATLVTEGHTDWTARFDDVTGAGPDATLGELATHTSGLWPDSTQIGMHAWLDQPRPRWSTVRRIVEVRGEARRVPGRHKYNNEGYALLGLAIEALTDRDYEAECQARALAPVGAEGALSPRSGAFGPWAGWAMAVADYALFHQYWFGPGDRLSGPQQADLGNGIFYGAGVMLRPTVLGVNRWHYGALCFPGRMMAGSFAVTLDNGWTLVAAYDGCPSNDILRDLERNVVALLHGENE